MLKPGNPYWWEILSTVSYDRKHFSQDHDRAAVDAFRRPGIDVERQHVGEQVPML